MNRKFGSFRVHESLKILCLSVKFLALPDNCKRSPFLPINEVYSNIVYSFGEEGGRTGEHWRTMRNGLVLET